MDFANGKAIIRYLTIFKVPLECFSGIGSAPLGKIKFTPQMTVPQFERLFPTDDACKAYLVARRWPQGVHCPRCGNVDVYPVTNRPFHWQCCKCAEKGGYRFSVLVGTIFENTNVP